MRCTFSNRRSKIPSAMVGSPSASCHMATGSWLVTMVERSWARSSITSKHVGGLVGGEWSEDEIVDHQYLDSRPGRHDPRQAAVGPGDGDLVEQRGDAQVERASARGGSPSGRARRRGRSCPARWRRRSRRCGALPPSATRRG